MNTGKKGIELIKQFEGCVLTAYRDAVGVWTIGYGHTSNVKQGMKITAQQAENFLKSDLIVYENYVKKYITYPINQNQFDALVSFTYNVGGGNLQKSTLRTYLNKGEIQKAADEFKRFVYAGGKVLNGLVRRRNAERELFLLPIEEDKELTEKIYNTISEIPDWGKATIQKLINKKFLVGNEKGQLNLTESMIKVFVVNDRAKLYD